MGLEGPLCWPTVKGLVHRVRLLEDSRTFKKWGLLGGLYATEAMPSKRFMGFGSLPHPLLLPSHQVSSFIPPPSPAMMDFLTIGPKPQANQSGTKPLSQNKHFLL